MTTSNYHPQAIAADGTKQFRYFELATKVRGEFRVAVVGEDGNEIMDTGWKPNLILDSGLDNVASRNWIDMLLAGVAGTGTTATKDTLDGTWSQTGTTVSSSGSTYTLTSGDVGKWISFASGEQAKITAHINGTSVTVNKSQTVAAGAANLYRANQTGLTTESKRSTTYASFTMNDGTNSRGVFLDAPAQKITLRETYDFSAEVGAVNYTEIGVSHTASSGANLFSRILLTGAVSVGIGQQLRVTYNLVLTVPNVTTRPTVTPTTTGWPTVYNISSITSNGTSWTITTATPHHLVSGGKVNIAGALCPKIAITAASSTGVDFTLTTGSAHGRSPGDSIVIEDVTPSAYNGTFVCAAGTAGSTIVVASALNPGTGTVFGTVRLATPGTWYNGNNYTMTTGTTGSTIVITNATVITAAGASGTVYNNTNMKYEPMFWGVGQRLTSGAGFVTTETYLYPSTASANNRGLMDPLSNVTVKGYNNGAKTAASFGTGGLSTTGNVHPDSLSEPAYVSGNFYKDSISTFDPGTLNLGTLRSFGLCAANTSSVSAVSGNSSAQLLLNFEEPQLKTSTYRLAITIRRSWTRVFA